MTAILRYGLYLLFDFWIGTRLGKAISIMISSVTQVVEPSNTAKRKAIRYVADKTYEKSMEDIAKEVQALFEEPLQAERLLECSAKLQDEYRGSLRSSSISMLPSYQHTLPTGREQGDFLALDVGGSTFRIALIRLGGKRCDGDGLSVRRVRSFAIDEDIRRLAGRSFFDWMAQRVGDILAEYNHMTGSTNARLQMGLAWSFPVEQTSLRTGRLLAMGKGFQAAQDLEGEDLGELVMSSCRARELNVELCAIVNDSAAALLAQAYRDPATRMSLILGTGINAAVFLPTSAIGQDKFGARSASWHKDATRVVVNTEMSMFGRKVLPTTRWDEDLNAKHKQPDFQPLEYLVTGRYLGEIVRLILLESIESAGLFDGCIPERLDQPYAFDTRILAAFENDQSTTMAEASAAFLSAHALRAPPKLRELEFIRDIARLASRRAAAYLATALHALWTVRAVSEGFEPGEAGEVTVACDGSMIEKYPGFRQLAQRHLDHLCALSGATEGAVTLEMAPESSIFGAAVSASCGD